MKENKIGILTLQNADNYGAVLQAYALTKFLQDNVNQTVEIINYHCEKIEAKYRPKALIVSLNPIRTIAKLIIKLPKILRIRYIFRKFRKDYLSLSKQSYSKKNKNEIGNDYKYIVVGSDQVWNIDITGDTIYYLDIEKMGMKKISYAASIGEISNDTKAQEVCKLMLSRFDALSAREASLAEYVMKLTNKKCFVHIDPVLLLTLEQWEALLTTKRKKYKYVLYFNVQDPNRIKSSIDFATDLARRNECPLYYLSIYGRKKEYKNVKAIFPTAPEEFLSWVKDAAFIVSDSFHGTALSIIFHKNFFSEGNITGSSRIADLLTLLGLKDRLIINGISQSCTDMINDKIWQRVDQVLNNERISSRKYLINNIGNLC